MFSLPVTVAKLAELSGLSESWIRRGVASGHLKTLCDEQPMMIEFSDFRDWVKNGRQTKREKKKPKGRGDVPQTPERTMAMGLTVEEARNDKRLRPKQTSGKKGGAPKAGGAKPTIYVLPDTQRSVGGT